MPPIFEETEHIHGFEPLQYSESFDYYKDSINQCEPCEPCYSKFCYDPCRFNYCCDPCYPNYSCDPCGYPSLKYEECFDCDVQPLYAKQEKYSPLAIDAPISMSNPCPPPRLCVPHILPTIYRKYHNRIGNPQILAEYVDILDEKCVPKRIFSKEYRDQEKIRQVGLCYTYKVKRKDKSRKRYDKYDEWEPRKIKTSRSHLTRVEPRYTDDINVRLKYKP